MEVDAAVLDSYAGTYFGVTAALLDDFGPVLVIQRDGATLRLEWNGRSFVLRPRSATAFATHDGFVSTLADYASVRFTGQPRGATVSVTGNGVPSVVATRVDSAAAQQWLADIARRSVARTPAPGSRELVDELMIHLGARGAPGTSPVARAARSAREQLDRWMPGALEAARSPEVKIREILPAGRDVYDLRFGDVVLHIDVVLGFGGTLDALAIDASCRRSDSTGRDGPCMVPFTVDLDTGDELAPSAGVFSGRASASRRLHEPRRWQYWVGVRGCALLEASSIAEVSGDVGPIPKFAVVSDLVRYAYALEPHQIVWPETVSDASVRDESRTGQGSVRHDECRAVVRRALAAEVSLAGHFETRTMPVWDLVSGGAEARAGPTAHDGPPEIWAARGAVYGRNADMTRLAAFLTTLFGEPVFNRTGNPGSYDFSHVWEAAPAGASDRRARDFSAFRASLAPWWGIAVAPAEREVTRLVIDDIALPPLPEDP